MTVAASARIPREDLEAYVLRVLTALRVPSLDAQKVAMLMVEAGALGR